MHYKNSSRYRLLLLFSLGIKVIRGFIKSFFHFRGCRIVAIGKNVSFLGERKDLSIGKRVKIEDGVSIQSVSEYGIQFSDNVTICQNSIIRPSGFMGACLERD